MELMFRILQELKIFYLEIKYPKITLIIDLGLQKLEKIDLWINRSSHVVAGCDWVEYLHHWDSVMISHFAIDITDFELAKKDKIKNEKFTILHAPNHKNIKGTQYIEKAIRNLNCKGYKIELKIIQNLQNKKLLEEIYNADLVIDQLIIGWYAMFAIESMALGTPVVCYLKDELLDFYDSIDLLCKTECPIINSCHKKIEETIEKYYRKRDLLKEIGSISKNYVKKHHSIDSVGEKFQAILKGIKLYPKS